VPELPSARIRRLAAGVGFETAWELVTTERDSEHAKLVAAGVDARTAAPVGRNQAAGLTIADPRELAKVIEEQKT